MVQIYLDGKINYGFTTFKTNEINKFNKKLTMDDVTRIIFMINIIKENLILF